jgi:hypothetical protein
MILKKAVDIGAGKDIEYWKVSALHVHFGDTVHLEVQGYLSMAAAEAGLALPGARRDIRVDYDEDAIGTDFEAQINAMLQSDDSWKTATSI